MKKILGFSIFLGIIFLICIMAYAGPFLVSDPYAASDGVTNFKVCFDGGAYVDSVPVSNVLHYDLGPLTNGSHTVKAQACNVWGCSADSSPFPFTKAAPAAPGNTRISPQ